MRFSFSRVVFLSFLLSFLCCCDPTSSLRPDIEKFEREYPQQLQTFGGSAGQMRFAWTGDPAKRPIIFVHGSPGSWEGWIKFLLNPDLQKNFHLISIDRPGYGGSRKGETEVSLEKESLEIMEVLKFNQSHLPAILVGHSFGGPVIARMAMDYPEKVGGLVFVASSVDPDLEITKWYQYPASWWPFRVMIPTELRVCNEEILPLKQELIKMTDLWKKIKSKSVLIQGEADDLVPPANLDFLIKNIDPQYVVSVMKIPGQNHFIPWQRPDLILDGIKAVSQALP